MDVTIIGTGYVGLVTGVCLAYIGHEVICCDIDEKKIEKLQKGISPIYEPGLEELLEKVIFDKKISFTTNIELAISKSQIIISAVGTPMGESSEADLQYVKQVAKVFSQNIKSNEFKLFVNKSTVPVGTAEMVEGIIAKNISKNCFEVISNPEFLREGCALKDSLQPSRIIAGCESSKAKSLMRELYLPFTNDGYELMLTDIKSAELIKYASNCMLATRISFMNELSRFCDVVGADITKVAQGMGMDVRIGLHFLQAGCGYGGSCFPKDIHALIKSADDVGIDLKLLKAVNRVNDEQKFVVVDKVLNNLGVECLEGKTIGIWGLSFKENTDDMREATSLSVISKCKSLGATIKVYDPIVTQEQFEEVCDLEVEWCYSQYDACKGVDVLCVLNCSPEFVDTNWEECEMRRKLIIDGRNCYDHLELAKLGFKCVGIGK